MLLSGGELVLSDTTPTFARTTYYPNTGIGLTKTFASYGEIYKRQLWVYVLVRKRALATARLPLKVYERQADGERAEARDSPFAQLLREPNPKHDPFFFWLWTSSTYDVFGEALWAKVRDGSGTPRELWPIHPSNVSTRLIEGDLFYLYLGGSSSTDPLLVIPAADIVHFKTYNPVTTVRGLSPLEPLRQTLINEDASRRASTGFWANGARPSMYLTHPKTISDGALKRLAAEWDSIHGGADNFGKTAILEEGMEPKPISMSAEEAAYIDSRKLNREECCAAYDTPPPVVHILDRATFSNITEQMRSMYRDTMAPHLGGFESTMDFELRPDFSDDTLYAEFLLDQVLRGDFEVRAEANNKAIGSAQRTPNELRRQDNLPPIAGGDRLYINSTFIPIDEVSSRTSPNPPAEDVPSAAPAKAELQPATPPIPKKAIRTVMGRLSRVTDLRSIDADDLTAGLNGAALTVRTVLGWSLSSGDDVAGFRERLKTFTAEED